MTLSDPQFSVSCTTYFSHRFPHKLGRAYLVFEANLGIFCSSCSFTWITSANSRSSVSTVCRKFAKSILSVKARSSSVSVAIFSEFGPYYQFYSPGMQCLSIDPQGTDVGLL
ncbi:hypothetical protein BLNAU_2649 [Blattamonas nauphoetae]|uniref:Uncharacterized protein n=1 Tax=Blattamonas nauphoetae TaxID=2049346 RepID=A0ABQ9YFK6_9EUKA|nr:hypothetical protein BLNAU_2649 [Blattamonas nauphoetae]